MVKEMPADFIRYVVAAIGPWNLDAFARHCPAWPGTWTLISEPEELSIEMVTALKPRFIFFPHWSWRVPESILEAAECVCFHMTDVPYGRGGSPLQNLINAGHKETMVSALRMSSELDSGPVYLKYPLNLDGRAQEIFERAAEIVFAMIGDIVRDEPAPEQQCGDAVYFQRRTPAESLLSAAATVAGAYDHIRMLDAEGYPHAFIDYGELRLEFSHAELVGNGDLTARVSIRKRPIE